MAEGGKDTTSRGHCGEATPVLAISVVDAEQLPVK